MPQIMRAAMAMWAPAPAPVLSVSPSCSIHGIGEILRAITQILVLGESLLLLLGVICFILLMDYLPNNRLVIKFSQYHRVTWCMCIGTYILSNLVYIALLIWLISHDHGLAYFLGFFGRLMGFCYFFRKTSSNSKHPFFNN